MRNKGLSKNDICLLPDPDGTLTGDFFNFRFPDLVFLDLFIMVPLKGKKQNFY